MIFDFKLLSNFCFPCVSWSFLLFGFGEICLSLFCGVCCYFFLFLLQKEFKEVWQFKNQIPGLALSKTFGYLRELRTFNSEVKIENGFIF